MQIGASHPAFREVLTLQRNTADGARPDQPNRTVAEGLWAGQAALDAEVRIPLFLWCEDELRGPEAVALAKALRGRAVESFEVSAKTFKRLSDRDKPDGLIAVVELGSWTPERLKLGASALLLIADGIEQPGNLGTLIRTLDACGADALIMTNTRTRRTNTKVFRASHGTVLRIPILDFDTVAQAQRWLDGQQFSVYLADTDGASRYSSTAYHRRSALVLGSERFGIDQQWYRPDAEKVFIPMLGSADSLNVSISAAVLLYEARSQLDGWR
ncbi:MAG: methyltransferase [Frankiales bacterium]|nr:methyltransferase [Frankiales bacterium]